MISIFEGQPIQNKAEMPMKTGVIWVLGIYQSHSSCLGYPHSITGWGWWFQWTCKAIRFGPTESHDGAFFCTENRWTFQNRDEGPKIYCVFCVGFGVVIIVIAKRSYTPLKMVVSLWIFLLHGSIFRGELLVSGRAVSCFVFFLVRGCLWKLLAR